jgi:hypothetical protein
MLMRLMDGSVLESNQEDVSVHPHDSHRRMHNAARTADTMRMIDTHRICMPVLCSHRQVARHQIDSTRHRVATESSPRSHATDRPAIHRMQHTHRRSQRMHRTLN